MPSMCVQRGDFACRSGLSVRCAVVCDCVTGREVELCVATVKVDRTLTSSRVKSHCLRSSCLGKSRRAPSPGTREIGICHTIFNRSSILSVQGSILWEPNTIQG
jgi:hypothetical protein